MLTAALFAVAEVWKPPKCPPGAEWTRQPWRTYTVEHYSAVEKTTDFTLSDPWLGLENIIVLSEISLSDKDKYHVISLICGI